MSEVVLKLTTRQNVILIIALNSHIKDLKEENIAERYIQEEIDLLKILTNVPITN
jgi:hypothetical protein